MLSDQFGRRHNYLRISLTEKCNLRCTYCMPENGVDLRPSKAYMTADEVVGIASEFVNLGVDKIRLTGGEPMVFKEFSGVVKELSKLPIDLSLTTNGLLLNKHFDELAAHGVKDLNISIDTLDENRFSAITRRNGLSKVWNAIEEALERGFNVKLNVVVIKGFNEDEVNDFIGLTIKFPIEVRFIEFMPFDGNKWNWDKVVPEAELLERVYHLFGEARIIKRPLPQNYIARTYRLEEAKGSFGFISTMTHSFCGGCNRIRLTADGHIKNCLFTSDETNLLAAFRKGDDIKPLIANAIMTKHEKNAGIDFREPASIHAHRSMISIGG